MHLGDLAQKIKEGCELEGMIGFKSSTVGVSDGMTQVRGTYLNHLVLRCVLTR